jgi:exodeoxyribonuclease VII large subunit
MSPSDIDAADHESRADAPTMSVVELAAAINTTLTGAFPTGIWVRGELSGWKDGPNGHAYFNLVGQEAGRRVQISVSLFANARVRLRPLFAKHRLVLQDGLKVCIKATLDFYGPSGRLGLKMSDIDPQYTLGELAAERDEVLRRLSEGGLLGANRTRPLTPVPLTIGVVTSVGSAAWHDFTDELDRSGIGFHLLALDVRVQGDGAVGMVAAAISTLANDARVDVVVVIRGGGSRADLAVFDAEQIAMSIVAAPVPVLTGLGHEIDRSIADEVAYLALKTPTACAGALIDMVGAYAARCEQVWSSLSSLARAGLERHQGAIELSSHLVVARARSVIERASARLVGHDARVPLVARQVIAVAATDVARCQGALSNAGRRHLDTAAARLDGAEGRVRGLDPALSLARGWSITRTAAGDLVRRRGDAPAGTRLITTVADGTVHSIVEAS